MTDTPKIERLRQAIGDFAVNKGKILLILSFILFIVAAYYLVDFLTEDSLAVKYKKTTALVEEVQETKNVLTIVTSQGFFVVDPGLRSDKYKNIADFFRKVKEDGSPVRIDYKDVGNDKVIENVFYRAESTKFGKVGSLK
jgi:hypothetical protein